MSESEKSFTVERKANESLLVRYDLLLNDPELPPEQEGELLIDRDGTIVPMSETSEIDRSIDVGILMPGIVNAHVHMSDASIDEPVPGGDGFIPWMRGLLASREGQGPVSESAVGSTVARMLESGTIAIGEVTNDVRTLEILEGLAIATLPIVEMIGLRNAAGEARDAIERFRAIASRFPGTMPAAHAPYSVHPELVGLLVEESHRRDRPFFIHLAEDRQERVMFEEGGGDWIPVLEEFGVLDGSFVPPMESVIRHYDRRGLIDEYFRAVHLTDATSDEIRLLTDRGAMAVLSPHSNRHITGQLPDVHGMIEAGLRFGFGTDGRGSNRTVDVVDEARLLLREMPDLSASRLLTALTLDGAQVLGRPELTSIKTGERPGLIAHDISVDSIDPDDIASAIFASTEPPRRIL